MRIERQAVFWGGALLITALAVVALRDVLLPFVVGMILAYALNPLAERLVTLGLSRTAASALVVLLVLICMGLVVVFLVPPLVGQAQHLIETMPAAFAKVRSLIEDIAQQRLGARFGEFKAGLDKAVAGLEIDWASILPALMKSAWQHGLAVVNFASLLLITPLVVFYLLVDWHPMLARVDGWLPRQSAQTIRRLAAEIDAAIGAFIRGQGLVCLILGGLYAVGLSWAGLRYGLLIGLATGLVSFVPFVGWVAGLLVAAGMIVAQAWPDLVPFYKVMGVFVAGMALDSAVLSPRIVGQRVGLHPLWLIFALFVFSYAMGTMGVLIAVPLAAAAAVLVRYGLEVYLASDVYRGPHASVAPPAVRSTAPMLPKGPAKDPV
jgi:predicted PurR-regulated permease PerM